MRVLYCTTGLLRGGAEAQAVELACRMKSRGHEVMFVSMTEVETDWLALGAHGIEVHSLGMRRGRPSIAGFARLVRLWNGFRPDVVHSHMFHANILVRLARLFGSRSRVICTAHSVDEGGYWRTALYRLTDGLADMTTNVSWAAVAAYARKGVAPANRIVWMPNGIDVDKFLFPASARGETRREMQWSEENFVWLAAGRLAEPKDYPTMIAACARLKAAGMTGWRLVIAGEGPLRAAIGEQIAAAGLTQLVQLLGIRADVPALMNAADGYVMSSAWEGLPMVLLEAAAARRPAVATQVGGNSEIVLTGKTGLIVPSRSPDELAQAMADIMRTTPARRAEMGAEARAYVSANYGIEQIVSQWERGYANPALWNEADPMHHRPRL